MLKFTKSILFVLLFQITVTYVSSTDPGLVKESHVSHDKDILSQNTKHNPHEEQQENGQLSTKKLNLLPKNKTTTLPAIHPNQSATDAIGSEPKKDPLMKSGRRSQVFFDMNAPLVSSSALEASSHSSHQHESKSSSFSSMASGVVGSGTDYLIMNPPIAGNMNAMLTGGQSSVAQSSSSHSHSHHSVSSSNSSASMSQGGLNLPGAVVQPGLVIPGSSQGFVQGSSAGESSLLMGSQNGAHQAINVPGAVVQPSLIMPGSSQGILQGSTAGESSLMMDSSMRGGSNMDGIVYQIPTHNAPSFIVFGGQSGQYLGQTGQYVGQSGQYLGQTGPYVGQSGQHLGQTGQYVGQSGQYLGQTGQYVGQSGQYLGQTGQYVGQSGQNVGHSGYDFGLSSPNLNVLQPGVLTNNYRYGEQAAAVALSMLEDGLYADELARLQQGQNMMIPAQPNAFIAVPVFRPDAGNVMLGYRPNIRYYIDQIGVSNFLKRLMAVREVPSFFSNFRAGQYTYLTQAQLQMYKKYLIKTGLIHLKPFQLIFSDNYWMKLPSVQWMVVDLGSWKQGQTFFGSLNMNARKLLVPILKLRNGFRRSMSGARTVASGVKEMSDGILRAAIDIPSHAANFLKPKDDKKSN